MYSSIKSIWLDSTIITSSSNHRNWNFDYHIKSIYLDFHYHILNIACFFIVEWVVPLVYMKLSALRCYLGYVDYPVVVIYAKSVTSSMSLGIPLTLRQRSSSYHHRYAHKWAIRGGVASHYLPLNPNMRPPHLGIVVSSSTTTFIISRCPNLI